MTCMCGPEARVPTYTHRRHNTHGKCAIFVFSYFEMRTMHGTMGFFGAAKVSSHSAALYGFTLENQHQTTLTHT